MQYDWEKTPRALFIQANIKSGCDPYLHLVEDGQWLCSDGFYYEVIAGIKEKECFACKQPLFYTPEKVEPPSNFQAQKDFTKMVRELALNS